MSPVQARPDNARPRSRSAHAGLAVALVSLIAVGAMTPAFASSDHGRHEHGHHANGHGHGHRHHKPRKTHKPDPTETPTTSVVVPTTGPVSVPVSVPTSAPVPTPTPAPSFNPGVLGTIGLRPLTGFGGAQNEWNRDVSSAPVDPNSQNLVDNLATQVVSRYNGVAAFNWNSYNSAFYTADSSTPQANVIWDNCQHKSYTPGQLYNPSQGGYFLNVPIPNNATPANGTDGELTVWDPSTDQLWEFWKANHQSDGWHACWGGRIDNYSTGNGDFPKGAGVSASGMAVAPGTVGILEAMSGTINHAIRIGIPQVANWQTYSYPANRSDGSLPLGTANAIAEGQRFRLDPSIDVDSLGLTPLATEIAKAAQKYGLIVTDKAGAVTVQTEDGAAASAATGVNPWSALMGGVRSTQIMAGFPWTSLQALPFNYGMGG